MPLAEPGKKSILVEGRNCWRIASACRASLLIDAESYFAVLAAAAARARHSILIVGWDIDSRIRLLRNNHIHDLPAQLDEMLNAVVSRQSNLHVYILDWDFAMIYSLERELFPVFNLQWKTHRRVHFRLDGNHPAGASHHQKIVVIDDALAFTGGIDLTKCRWDTPHHSPDDPRRVDPAGNPYAPFHDVQMAVDGAAAAALGELVRERWRRGTEKPIIPAAQAEYDPWPAELPVDMEHVDVGIARTIPAFQGNSEVKEVETVYRDAISAAHRFIYIENQYFTSAVIGELLESRLGEKDGPEIVMVLPKRSSGWLERSTMDVRRSRLLQRLRTADRFGHLRIYYPVVPGLGEEQINVHSKVLVVDNHLVKIGSSNISNRSMGLDTECDLAIEAAESRTEKAIAAFRSRLLGEHLGVDPEHVSETLSSEGSLISSVEKLRGGGRSLLPVSSADPEWTDNLIADIGIADPEKPLDPETFIEEFIPEEIRSPKSRRLFWIAGILVFMVFLSAAWRWTPLNKWIDLQNLGAVADTLRGSTAAPFIMLAIYPIGSLILIPVTLMIVSTAFIFGPLAGLIYSLLGSMFAAAFTYGIGRFLGRDTVRRLGGSRINRLSKRLSRHGVITTAVVRMLPIAPFTVVSMAAGASHIHFRDFIFGTLLGMSPGIIAITIFEHRLEVAIQEPGTESFAILAILLVLIIIAAVLFRRWLSPTEYVDNPQEKE